MEDVIVVLDVFGFMWGCVDEIEKIVIVREVIGNLFDELLIECNFGLVVYGYNCKGDCMDIEELVFVGFDWDIICISMNKLNLIGKMLLSVFVKFVVEKLKYIENKVIVILVSDGIEICDFDFCEVGIELE